MSFTAFVKRQSSVDTTYIEVDFSGEETVGKLCARTFSSFSNWSIPRDQVFVYHIKRGGRRPSAEEEAAAVLLSDPSELASAPGIGEGSWLLAREMLAPLAAQVTPAAISFEADVTVLETLLNESLTP
jgi:hypothetical protein